MNNHPFVLTSTFADNVVDVDFDDDSPLSFLNDNPFPSIYELFSLYNRQYFQGKLVATTVEWSDRMTLCAGICYLKSQSGTRYCAIRLSRPLLQYRPFRDTKSTLLHEMIHAFLWIKTGYLDRDGHGEPFIQLADLINMSEGGRVEVTVYHRFHAEVQACRRHVWRCNGSCREWAPFFGWVRRAMNRPPQPADRWWKDHQVRCGGTFIKIEEPAVEEKKKSSPSKSTKPTRIQGPIDHFVGKPNFARDKVLVCPACDKYKTALVDSLNDHLDACLQRLEDKIHHHEDDEKLCPVCEEFITSSIDELYAHIEGCLEGTSGKPTLNPPFIPIIDLT